MLYTTWKVNDKEYKLRLTTRAMVEVEEKLGENPVNAFINLTSGENVSVPKVGMLMTVLWGAMQPLNHNISEAAVHDLYDAFIDEGHNVWDLVPIILEIFKVSGFLSARGNDKDEEKN